VFPLAITVLATWHQITLARFAAADERHEVVHGQFFGRKVRATVMADAGAALTLPPLASAQLPRFSPLAPNLILGNFD
jgi:hypothetical protein